MKKYIKITSLILFVLCTLSAFSLNAFATDVSFEMIEAPETPTRPNIAEEELPMELPVPDITVVILPEGGAGKDETQEQIPDNTDGIEIIEEQIPLSDIPKTGDASLLLVPFMGTLGIALALLGRYIKED